MGKVKLSNWDMEDNVGGSATEGKKLPVPRRTGGALWRPCLIGLAIGSLLAGLALATVVVLFVQGRIQSVQILP